MTLRLRDTVCSLKCMLENVGVTGSGSGIKVQGRRRFFGVRFCNQKGLTGQLGSTHGKFSTDWRAARSDFASLPLEKRVMVVHTTKPFAFRQIRQAERTVSHEPDVYLGKTFRAALPLSS